MREKLIITCRPLPLLLGQRVILELVSHHNNQRVIKNVACHAPPFNWTSSVVFNHRYVVAPLEQGTNRSRISIRVHSSQLGGIADQIHTNANPLPQLSSSTPNIQQKGGIVHAIGWGWGLRCKWSSCEYLPFCHYKEWNVSWEHPRGYMGFVKYIWNPVYVVQGGPARQYPLLYVEPNEHFDIIWSILWTGFRTKRISNILLQWFKEWFETNI